MGLIAEFIMLPARWAGPFVVLSKDDTATTSQLHLSPSLYSTPGMSNFFHSRPPVNVDFILRTMLAKDNDGNKQPPEQEETKYATDVIQIEQPHYHVYNPVLSNWEHKDIHRSMNSGQRQKSTGITNPDTAIMTGSKIGSVTSPPSSFSLVSWNVDFMAAYESERLVAILDYIHRKYANKRPPLILLQELSFDCFPTLLSHPLVRASYALSDISSATWSTPDSSYGLVTLIPLHLVGHMNRKYRVPFDSSMAREVLFVDFCLCAENLSEPCLVRIANTHLESLREAGDRRRPKQLALIACHLRGIPEKSVPGTTSEPKDGFGTEVNKSTPHAGLVAGDMNPIGPDDVNLPACLDLLDAWEVQAQREGIKEEGWDVEDANEKAALISAYTFSPSKRIPEDDRSVIQDPTKGAGFTWGTQPHNYFPKRRMDKILYTPSSALQISKVRRIGVGLKTRVKVEFDGSDFDLDRSTPQQEDNDDAFEEVWATDHLGLAAEVMIMVKPGL